MTSPLIITIDGPAGAGKSTVAQSLAARLGLTYVDSGATYRAAALKVVQSGVSLEDENAVAAAVAATQIEIVTDDGQSVVYLDGCNVAQEIRTPEVTLAAAQVSRLPEVRKKLIALQRSLARGKGVVMEGRDIGTVVFPDTPHKFYLDAAAEERAKRRHAEIAPVEEAGVDQVLDSLTRRDRKDSTRATAPLQIALGARVIDSTTMSAEQVAELVIQQVRRA